MTEKVIRDCAKAFYSALQQYATKLDLGHYDHPRLQLTVRWDKEKGPTVDLEFSGGSYTSSNIQCKHTSLALLMAEVLRRHGFDDKAEMSIATESAALKAITFVDPNEQ